MTFKYHFLRETPCLPQSNSSLTFPGHSPFLFPDFFFRHSTYKDLSYVFYSLILFYFPPASSSQIENSQGQKHVCLFFYFLHGHIPQHCPYMQGAKNSTRLDR